MRNMLTYDISSVSCDISHNKHNPGFRWMPSFAYIMWVIYLSLRWHSYITNTHIISYYIFFLNLYFSYGFICTGVRLRKASLVRNHHTPVDFITDRWRSQMLRYTILTIQVLASFVYLSAQVNALQSTFNSMFGFDPSDVWPVIVIMIIILGFEWLGGLAVVALSDAIQAFVMLISFICLPIVILRNYGGWKDIDPLTYGRPDFYQTPSSDDQWQFWQFSLINICFFTLPHLVQRVYAARDLASLKVGFVVNCVGPWMTSFGKYCNDLNPTPNYTSKPCLNTYSWMIQQLISKSAYLSGLWGW